MITTAKEARELMRKARLEKMESEKTRRAPKYRRIMAAADKAIRKAAGERLSSAFVPTGKMSDNADFTLVALAEDELWENGYKTSYCMGKDGEYGISIDWSRGDKGRNDEQS